MLCWATQGKARRYFSTPSPHRPLIPRILKAGWVVGSVAGAWAFTTTGTAASMIHAMNNFVRICIGSLLMFKAMTFAASPSVSSSFTRQEDIIYGRSYGTALTFDLFKPTGQANGAGI